MGSGHPVCAVFQESVAHVCVQTHTHTRAHTRIFSARMTVNKVLKPTAAVLQHGGTTLRSYITRFVILAA